MKKWKKILLNIVISGIKSPMRKRSLRRQVIMECDCEGKEELIQKALQNESSSWKEIEKNWTPSHEGKTILILSHQWGGGAEYYLRRIMGQLLNEGNIVFLATWSLKCEYIVLDIYEGEMRHTYHLLSLLEFCEDSKLNFDQIILNELVSWKLACRKDLPSSLGSDGLGRDIPDILEQIVEVSNYCSAPIIHCYHDHFPVCPSITLIDWKGEYCGICEREEICSSCMRKHNDTKHSYFSILRWRQAWQYYFDHVSIIRFYSKNSMDIFSKVFSYPENKMELIPHDPLIHYPHAIRIQAPEHPVIGIVGSMHHHKGSDLVLDAAERLFKEGSPVKFVIVGELHSQRKIPANIEVIGKYERENLPDILEKHSVNIACISSIWPETFSYVTQELMQLNLPVICFDLGAPPERVRTYDKGYVIKSISPDSLIEGIKEFYHQLYS